MNRLPLVIAALFALSVPAHAIDPKAATPPVAPKHPHSFTLHGVTVSDDYFWLKEKKNPETTKQLVAENAYLAAVMKPTEALQKKLYAEYLSRIKQTDLSVPYREGNYWYLSKTFTGKQYPTFVRRKGAPDGPEEVVLDVNKIAEGKKFTSARPVDVSDDEKFLIFATDFTGYREYKLSVLEIATGKLLEDQFVKAHGGNAAWSADGRTIFYVTEDAAKRPHKLWRHVLGEPLAKDALIHEEKVEQFNLRVRRSRDKKYLFAHAGSSNTTEEWFLPADDPAGVWKSVLGRSEGREYATDHHNGKFYIRTNADGAVNFKVAIHAPGSPTAEAELVSHDPAVYVTGCDLFADFAVISERRNGVPGLRIIDFRTKQSHGIDFPEPSYSAGLGANPEFFTRTIQFNFSSFITPDSVFEYDPLTKARALLKQKEIPAGHRPEDYVVERIAAKSADGTMVPISLVSKRGVPRDGSAPCLLYGYGSYGATSDARFDPAMLSLLDRGVVFALAHIRGSSDLGRPWYDDGKMMRKRNTFLDFIACADHLVAAKYCARDRLALNGGSAGGLLVGASIALRPDLCRAAILEVPFVDVVNTMLDETLPLTTQEFLEWGNPKIAEQFAYLRTYCPYTNIKKGKYPAMLLTTSLNDSQVAYHEPAKFAAKMRELNPDATLLFKCNMDAGHGGASGRYDRLKERALVMAFMLDQIGAAGK
ncbi:MAG TPA: S9 family peptidase [Planctomycetia bacterium]|nr:S9 family peptidase [Planctomycetia bacterium]